MTWLGWLALTELRFDEAQAVLDEAVTAGRGAGDRSALGFALDWLGYVLLAMNDTAAAGRTFAEARGVLEEVGNYHLLGYAIAGLGAEAMRNGDVTSTERLLTDGLQLLHAVPDAIGVPLVQEMLACSGAIVAEAERVLVLAGAAAELRALCRAELSSGGVRRAAAPVGLSQPRAAALRQAAAITRPAP